MRRLSRTLALLAVVLGAGSLASAHETAPGSRLRIDRIEPAFPELEIRVRNVLAPTILVNNDTAETFEAVGSDGQPFLRLRDGGVEANVASPDWYRSESPTASGWIAPTARAGAKPRWVRIASGDEWAWFEHRIGAPGPAGETPWTIPARIGGRAIVIHGSWFRTQVRGSFRTLLDGVRPAVDEGIEVRILQGTQPAIFVNNATGKVLEIPGRRGEPFLRIGPAGAEQADPAGAYASLGTAPRWAWVEPRAGWSDEDPPENALRSTTTVVLGTWAIPASLDGSPIEIYGRVEWVPVAEHHAPQPAAGSNNKRWILIAVAATVTGAIVGIRTIRRRRQHG
ncbi:MAG: hypothetical protein ACRDKG_02480 [Actinomycetota bacterium]